MTAAHSPLRVLKAQADNIAKTLKAIERGEMVATDPAGKIDASRAKGSISFAVAMDDRILKIEMPWATICDTSEVGIAEYILKQMRGVRDTVQ
jgi:hypothetical protein